MVHEVRDRHKGNGEHGLATEVRSCALWDDIHGIVADVCRHLPVEGQVEEGHMIPALLMEVGIIGDPVASHISYRWHWMLRPTGHKKHEGVQVAVGVDAEKRQHSIDRCIVVLR